MLFSQLLQNGGVEITPEIKALINKFRDRWISKQFQNNFQNRIQLLDEPLLFGFIPERVHSLGKNDNGSHTSLVNVYSYRSKDFMEKFPQFEMLFVKIWCLIHTSPDLLEFAQSGDLVEYVKDDENRENYYFYHRRAANEIVKVIINDDSVNIKIEHLLSHKNKVEFTIR
jgi:hypothetical protein